jgi:hypothetical protein
MDDSQNDAGQDSTGWVATDREPTTGAVTVLFEGKPLFSVGSDDQLRSLCRELIAQADARDRAEQSTAPLAVLWPSGSAPAEDAITDEQVRARLAEVTGSEVGVVRRDDPESD